MSTLTRITLGRLAVGGGASQPAAGLIDVSVGVLLAAEVAASAMLAQVNQGLAISVAGPILGANVASPLTADVETILVEVDIC